MQITPLQRQLESLKCLDKADFATLEKLLGQEKTSEKAEHLIVEGGALDEILFLSAGWAMRYKSLADGRRQVLNFLLPGDILGFFSLLFKTSEFGVETLTAVKFRQASPEQTLEAFKEAPRLAVALNWLSGRVERQLDEQIVRVGRRAASERMAHLFMELHYRLLQVGIAAQEARYLPLTQTILADTLGMSHIHANRSFRSLVRAGLVEISDNKVFLVNIMALSRFAHFDADYLAKGSLPPSTTRALVPKLSAPSISTIF